MLKALLEAGAKLDARSIAGETALIRAASNGVINNVRALVLAGANMEDCDASGKNALWYANDNNQPAVIRFLRSRGGFASVVKDGREE